MDYDESVSSMYLDSMTSAIITAWCLNTNVLSRDSTDHVYCIIKINTPWKQMRPAEKYCTVIHIT